MSKYILDPRNDSPIELKTEINGKLYNVVQRGKRYYFFSPRAGRLLPVAKAKVIQVLPESNRIH